MADGSEVRAWGELIPEVLGLIFRNLPLQEVLTVIPRVCKSWGRAVSGPDCWQEIDIDEWSRSCDPDLLDQMLRMLIERSCGSFHRLSVFGLRTESMFTFIADHAGSLERLELQKSKISDSIVELVAPRLSSLTYLDLSYCTKIGARAIEAFGKHCRSLVVFCRRMQPFKKNNYQQEEAFAIAKMMTKLRHLEMSHQHATTRGVLEILSNCKDLKYLDIRGCWHVKLDEKYLKEWHSGVKVQGLKIPDLSDVFTDNEIGHLNADDVFTDYEIGHLNADDVFTDYEIGDLNADDVFTDYEIGDLNADDVFTDYEIGDLNDDDVNWPSSPLSIVGWY